MEVGGGKDCEGSFGVRGAIDEDGVYARADFWVAEEGGEESWSEDGELESSLRVVGGSEGKEVGAEGLPLVGCKVCRSEEEEERGGGEEVLVGGEEVGFAWRKRASPGEGWGCCCSCS